MRTLIWFAYFWGYLLIKWPILHKALKRQKNGDWAYGDQIAEKYVMDWTTHLLKLAGATVETRGLENIPKDRACVFAANHRSYYDICVLLNQLDKPHGLVAKKEVSKIPQVRGWMKLLHCVFLDRENPRQAVTALNEAAENLEKGYSMAIFPEGTRNKGEEASLLEFKSGAFRMAGKAKAPVIPVAISGTRDLMENHHMMMTPGHVVIQILPPIETENLSRAELKDLPDQVREQILAALETVKNA